MIMGFTDSEAADVNVLIYPISDECHEFRGDLAAFNNKIRTDILGDKSQGIRGILDDLLRRIRPEDTVLVTSDHGFTELLAGDAAVVADQEAQAAGCTPQEDVRYRYTKGRKGRVERGLIRPLTMDEWRLFFGPGRARLASLLGIAPSGFLARPRCALAQGKSIGKFRDLVQCRFPAPPTLRRQGGHYEGRP